MFHRALVVAALGLVLGGCPSARPPAPAPRYEAKITWDTYGVPHIDGRTDEAVMAGLGWAQMDAHAELFLGAVARARGRAAEYFGASAIESDRRALGFGQPERARRWLAALSPEGQARFQAFVSGANAWAKAHPAEVPESLGRVLPLVPEDVLLRGQQVFLELRMASRDDGPPVGSNAWAVGPTRTRGGAPILLANPHLPWVDDLRLFEAQLTAPGLDVTGVAIVGLPAISIGFTDRLAWTHTLNMLDGIDEYELELVEGGYRHGDGVRAIERETRTIQVREPDGRLRPEEVVLERSVHGPIVRSETRTTALRIAGQELGEALDVWWAIAHARDRAGFEAQLARGQIPGLSTMYAGVDGTIAYDLGIVTPRRPPAAHARGLLSGADPSALWTDLLPVSTMPRLVNPATGWLQAANDPPWWSTVPQVLRAEDFPSYLDPRLPSLRAQRSMRLLAESGKLDLDEVIRLKHSTRVELADRVLDELVALGRRDPRTRAAAELLAAWDRTTEAGSRGAVLFAAWVLEMQAGGRPVTFTTPFDPARPFTTPRGLADPARGLAALVAATAGVTELFGAIDVPWGQVHRVIWGNLNLPVSGGPEELGIFRAIAFADFGRMRRVVAGDTYVLAVELSTPPRARAVLGYGNASAGTSPHRTDQLELFAKGALRPVWRTAAELAGNTSRTETLRF